MRFLIDAQLPPAFARWLVERGHDAEHVADCGLTSATDPEIWFYASSAGMVIITKDEDFATRRILAAAGPPIVWIRRGNTTRRQLLRWLTPLLADIVAALECGETLVEVV
jgi:predicted nuclease of predicted toxin-antitoxin system